MALSPPISADGLDILRQSFSERYNARLIGVNGLELRILFHDEMPGDTIKPDITYLEISPSKAYSIKLFDSIASFHEYNGQQYGILVPRNELKKADIHVKYLLPGASNEPFASKDLPRYVLNDFIDAKTYSQSIFSTQTSLSQKITADSRTEFYNYLTDLFSSSTQNYHEIESINIPKEHQFFVYRNSKISWPEAVVTQLSQTSQGVVAANQHAVYSLGFYGSIGTLGSQNYMAEQIANFLQKIEDKSRDFINKIKGKFSK